MAREKAGLCLYCIYAFVSCVYAQVELPPTIFCYDGLVHFQNVDVGTVSVVDTIDGSKHVEINGTVANDIWLMERTSMTFDSGNARVRTRESSVLTFNAGFSETLELHGNSGAYLHGGDISYIMAFENSQVHFYGYGFEIIRYDATVMGTIGPVDGLVAGFWADGTPFSIDVGNYHNEDSSIDNSITFDHFVFHEIPEPTTLYLFACGLLVAAKKGKGLDL